MTYIHTKFHAASSNGPYHHRNQRWKKTCALHSTKMVL